MTAEILEVANSVLRVAPWGGLTARLLWVPSEEAGLAAPFLTSSCVQESPLPRWRRRGFTRPQITPVIGYKETQATNPVANCTVRLSDDRKAQHPRKRISACPELDHKDTANLTTTGGCVGSRAGLWSFIRPLSLFSLLWSPSPRHSKEPPRRPPRREP